MDAYIVGAWHLFNAYFCNTTISYETRSFIFFFVLFYSFSRALGGVISKYKTLRDCGYKTFTKLFETGVLSILNYGAEIWGYGNFPKCDNVMNRAMRLFLGVHRFAPTAALQGDMD